SFSATAAGLSSFSWRSPVTPCDCRSATRVSFGTASLSISSLLVFRSAAKDESPVTLPPGRARLATRPSATGSTEVASTMGMALVAPFAANGVRPPPETTIRSTLRRTSSAASSGMRSLFWSANRYSMLIFFPSTHPSFLSSCRNASTRTALPEALLGSKKPMRKIFPVCCASTEPQSAKSMAHSVKTVIFLFMFFLLSTATRHSTLFSLDHLIRTCQHVRRNRQTDLLRCFQIDDELELHRLLDRKITSLGTFENLVHISGGAAEQVGKAHTVAHKPPVFHKFWPGIYGRKPALCREVCNLSSL